ncbi:hypothetical protein CFE70_009518 [Pyrenophora teres f. teres 0-1]|uniref:Uncharacterized protein n=2 Tax=Pyrenophora teres f. teres TaxID=97479 RepID=E3RYC1_PYRTT|nr:hypothetical protein PTT_14517 [Pyrenophora teres f. teres 0-1]KAE8824000.1 hypothetical protein HRS9139_09182 [Pyrenophora teres f. teres]KAE8827205.1 hypothetical protein PTNB85_08558 [Pyrenophora teres f. teres]KAE8831498.1 hypothetical protein HRS9122_09088 [Pyrenophora teres f. teres]KAE8855057.1 hypothetical protein PTNB29_09308 [Pyrenophora teres f. teres]
MPDTPGANKEPHSNSTPDHTLNNHAPEDVRLSLEHLREQCKNMNMNDLSKVRSLRKAAFKIKIADQLTIPDVGKMIKSMEKAEAEEKDAYKSLKQHRDSYDKQLQEYIKLNPDMAFQVYEERFSPEFFLRGHLAAKRHSEAEKAAKECRREAHEAGLPHVNEENQRSGFHKGIGKGLGYHDESEMGVELSKHKRIDEWLGAPEKTCKLDPKEREYAFSGGHISFGRVLVCTRGILT